MDERGAIKRERNVGGDEEGMKDLLRESQK